MDKPNEKLFPADPFASRSTTECLTIRCLKTFFNTQIGHRDFYRRKGWGKCIQHGSGGNKFPPWTVAAPGRQDRRKLFSQVTMSARQVCLVSMQWMMTADCPNKQVKSYKCLNDQVSVNVNGPARQYHVKSPITQCTKLDAVINRWQSPLPCCRDCTHPIPFPWQQCCCHLQHSFWGVVASLTHPHGQNQDATSFSF